MKRLIYRELKLTGYMSNRGRQNVASFLIYDLNIDWRLGAHYFESQLIDHDVYLNYGNWNSAAALLGGRINRFNIQKQANDYDPEGKYLCHWLPELSLLPLHRLNQPWKMSLEEQKKYKCTLGVDYPSPVPLETYVPQVHDKGSISVASMIQKAGVKKLKKEKITSHK